MNNHELATLAKETAELIRDSKRLIENNEGEAMNDKVTMHIMPDWLQKILPPVLCDYCNEPLGKDYIEYGDGESGYICVGCYSSLADNPLMENR